MREIKKLNLDKAVKVSLIVGVLIISFSVLYYLVILPNQNKKELEKCLSEAKQKFEEEWMINCHSIYGEKLIQEHDDLCESLPADFAEDIKAYYQRAKNDCFRQSPK